MLFGSRLNRLATSIRRGISKYSVGSDNPGLVFDFIDNFYQKDKNQTVNFDGAITHARAGNATMTDGYGPELVTNGGFDSDSDWTLGDGWSISDGVLSTDGSMASYTSATQSAVTVSGKMYVATFKLDMQSGAIDLKGSGVYKQLYPADSGLVTVIFQADSANVRFTTNSAIGSIDNVSVREMPVLKWAPHNLLSYSEDFSTSWVTTNSTPTASQSDPFGGTSATKITADTIGSFVEVRNNITGYANTKTTVSAIFKAIGVSSLTLRLRDVASVANRMDYALNISSGTGTATVNGTYSSASGEITDLGDGWYKANLTAITGSNTSQRFDIYISSANAVSTGDFLIADAHVYRSDLGGMVDNPDRGDSYVPTTSSAKYLPRIGHHVYNGSAWVNEGLLAESEARTNDALYSTILTAQYNKTGAFITDNSAVAPTGVEEAATITETTAANSNHRFDEKVLSTTQGTRYTFSIYAKKKERSVIGFGGVGLYNAGENVEFDLDNGIAYNGGTGNALVSIQDVGNGWFRCMMTWTVAGSAQFRVHLHDTLLNSSPPSGGGYLYTGDGTSGVYVWGLQIEEGDTASSFIPNSGTSAGVTRAAETFTIPSANLPWPEPNYIGPELVDATSVTAGSGWTVTDADTVSAASVASVYLAETESIASGLVDGNVYFASVQVTIAGSGTTAGFSTSGGMPTTARSFTNGTATIETPFVYDSSNLDGNIRIFKSGTNNAVTFDNISVREIDPLSVSIAQDGRVSYADTDDSGEVKFYRWYEGGSTGYLQGYIDTSGARTGQVIVRTNTNSVTDNSVASTTYFSPNVLIPYNLASRNGSTFVRGAESGVLFSANTTPTALPDLSATDLNLAPTYMGTIGTFRVWDKDLGDDGIVEATNPSLEPSLSLTFEGTGTNSFVVNNWSE